MDLASAFLKLTVSDVLLGPRDKSLAVRVLLSELLREVVLETFDDDGTAREIDLRYLFASLGVRFGVDEDGSRARILFPMIEFDENEMSLWLGTCSASLSTTLVIVSLATDVSNFR